MEIHSVSHSIRWVSGKRLTGPLIRRNKLVLLISKSRFNDNHREQAGSLSAAGRRPSPQGFPEGPVSPSGRRNEGQPHVSLTQEQASRVGRKTAAPHPEPRELFSWAHPLPGYTP